MRPALPCVGIHFWGGCREPHSPTQPCGGAGAAAPSLLVAERGWSKAHLNTHAFFSVSRPHPDRRPQRSRSHGQPVAALRQPRVAHAVLSQLRLLRGAWELRCCCALPGLCRSERACAHACAPPLRMAPRPATRMHTRAHGVEGCPPEGGGGASCES